MDVAAGGGEGGAPDTTPITTNCECAFSNTMEYSYPVAYVEYLVDSRITPQVQGAKVRVQRSGPA